ncbi:hypothetical protein [uncultured Gammaproteobacteria bacterium]|nr:hypothetical protein [uncultured Gammaproteobacteria bacterium]
MNNQKNTIFFIKNNHSLLCNNLAIKKGVITPFSLVKSH